WWSVAAKTATWVVRRPNSRLSSRSRTGPPARSASRTRNTSERVTDPLAGGVVVWSPVIWMVVVWSLATLRNVLNGSVDPEWAIRRVPSVNPEPPLLVTHHGDPPAADAVGKANYAVVQNDQNRFTQAYARLNPSPPSPHQAAPHDHAPTGPPTGWQAPDTVRGLPTLVVPRVGAATLIGRLVPGLEVSRTGDRYSFRLVGEGAHPVELTRRTGGDPGRIVEELIEELRRLAAGPSRHTTPEARTRRLRNLGVNLWADAVPEAIRQQFWQLRDRIRAFTVAATWTWCPGSCSTRSTAATMPASWSSSSR